MGERLAARSRRNHNEEVPKMKALSLFLLVFGLSACDNSMSVKSYDPDVSHAIEGCSGRVQNESYNGVTQHQVFVITCEKGTYHDAK